MSKALTPGVREARAPYVGATGARAPGPFRFTFDDLVKMRAAGVFQEGEHVELVDGECVLMPSEGAIHAGAVTLLIDWFTRILHGDPARDARLVLMAHATLLFDDGNRREPDIMIVNRSALTGPVGPGDVALVIEAANTSAPTDLGAKRVQYATANIPEYWVWETQAQRLSVFPRPQDGDYGFKDTFTPGQTIAPLFAPDAMFDCGMLAG